MIFQMVMQKEGDSNYAMLVETVMAQTKMGYAANEVILFDRSMLENSRFEFWFVPDEQENTDWKDVAFSPCLEDHPNLLLGRVLIGDREYFASLVVVDSGPVIRYEVRGRISEM